MAKSYYILKLGLDRITPSILLLKVRNMVAKLTGNAAFPTPIPTLVDVTAAADELEAAIIAHEDNPGPGEVVERSIAFQKVKGLYIDLGGYVQAASNGDHELIKSAGGVVRRSPSPIGELPAPKKVTAVSTPFAGRIDISWGGVRGRSMYEPEMCSGDPKVESDWKPLFLTTKNRHTITGLESGKLYYFRVKAIGTAGSSPVSDQAVAKAA